MGRWRPLRHSSACGRRAAFDRMRERQSVAKRLRNGARGRQERSHREARGGFENGIRLRGRVITVLRFLCQHVFQAFADILQRKAEKKPPRRGSPGLTPQPLADSADAPCPAGRNATDRETRTAPARSRPRLPTNRTIGASSVVTVPNDDSPASMRCRAVTLSVLDWRSASGRTR